MLNRTITNNCLVVIFCAAVCVAGTACHRTIGEGGRRPAFEVDSSAFDAVRVVGTVESREIVESSGVTASGCHEDLLWTHNDSGDGAYLFAMEGNGRHRGTWKVENADNTDWEDVASYKDASGNCFLVIGDIGNSRKDMRTVLTIYRVAEPSVTDDDAKSSRRSPRQTEAAEVLSFTYPDQPHDAETLMIHPANGDIYVVTKQKNKAAGVYRIAPRFGSGGLTAEKISDLTVPAVPNGFLTGGSIAPDGSRLVLCDYFAAYEFVLPAQAAGFDDIWKQKPIVLNLGDRQQGEAIAYSPDGNSVFATSEGVSQPLLRATRRQ